ncbi:MAG: c-type cytochrome [Chloroflexi bacterium]|nr:c-type cytochrome [Chloroflexota bacterium]
MRRTLLAALGAVAVLLLVVLASLAPPARGDDASLEPGSVERGEVLYRAGCQTCHGPAGGGVDPWPAIANAGEASADFQLRTGRMPHAGEPDDQAQPKPPAYDEQSIRDLVAFVGSLGDGPAIPDPVIDESLLQRGQQLFAVNCAPCHGATGNGGAVGGGAIAWPLTDASPRIVAEAMLAGPGQMPVFALPDDDLSAVATYVQYLQEAPNPGGFAIGGIGPVPEGFVAWVVGAGLLIAIAWLIGRRWSKPEGDEPA